MRHVVTAVLAVALVSGAGILGHEPSAAAPRPGPTLLPSASPTPLPTPPQLPVLRRLALYRLPDADDNSGSIAFDGFALYYGDIGVTKSPTSVIHRIRASDGSPLPDVRLPLANISLMSYNPRAHALFAFGGTGKKAGMYHVPLGGGPARRLFKYGDYWWHFSYDPVADLLVVAPDGGSYLQFLRPTDGKVVKECNVSELPVWLSGASTLAASGTGEVYIQAEDDATVARVRSDCTLLSMGVHEHYAEAAENDSMACDTVTFGVPAMWIRDGAAQAVVAYEVPGGQCPLPTQLDTVRAPATLVGTRVQACTRLHLVHQPLPLAAHLVRLEAEGRVLGTARTDLSGRACAPYTPRTTGVKPLRASYGGSIAYLPSTATGRTTVSRPVVTGPDPQQAGPAANQPPDPAAPAPIQPVPQPVAQAQALQLQPGTQTQPQVQSQAQLNAALVPQVQEELQVAQARADRTKPRDLELRRYRPRRSPAPWQVPLAAGVVAVIAAALWPAFGIRPNAARASHRR